MTLLTRLRGIRYQIKKLQENQKEQEPVVRVSSGSYIESDPLAEIDRAIAEAEAVYTDLGKTQKLLIEYLTQ